MAINFAKPVNADAATGVLSQLIENINSILTQTQGSGTNLPTSTLRWNPSTGVPESWNGSVWSRFAGLAGADRFLARSLVETGIAANKFYTYDGTNFVIKALQDLITTSLWGGTSTGSANAQACSSTTSPVALATGQVVSMKAGFTNTASCTLAWNGLAATTIFDSRTNLALVGNEILANGVYLFVYSGSNFYLLNGCVGRATWGPSLTGFSVNPTNSDYSYILNGKMCTVFIRQGGAGTSNATGFTVSAPFTAATRSNALWGNSLFTTTDNGVDQTTPGVIYIASAGTVFTLAKTTAGVAASWTGSSTKRADGQITYEIA